MPNNDLCRFLRGDCRRCAGITRGSRVGLVAAPCRTVLDGTLPSWSGISAASSRGWRPSSRPVARSLERLASPPVDLDERRSWYLAHLEQTLDVLSQTNDAEVWTFSSRGVNNVGWWRRRLAVETAIHRWDAEYAISATARELDGEVAAAGIEEFVDEFLPGLLAQPTVTGLNGMLQLEATDNQRRWVVDLDARRTSTASPLSAPGSGAVIRGTLSDLLLWLTNREPSPSISRQSDIAALWNQLRR